MFYLCYLSVYFFISPSQNWRMDDSWVFYEQLELWFNFNIPCLVSSPCLPVFGEMGKLPPVSPKNWWCPHSLTCHSQTAQHMKTGRCSFKRGIISLHFGENTQVSLYQFWRKCGGHIVQVSVKSVAIVLLWFSRWRCYTADSLLLWRVTE